MTTAEHCAELRDALTEVALGVADGATRSRVMAHLATCESCRAELASLADAADDVLLLVPEREPAADFEGRVLARLGSARPAAVRRHRVRHAVLAGAVAVGLLGVGGTGVWIATAPDRELAASYRTTLDTADGRYLAAADLTTGIGSGTDGTGRSVGTVFLYEGDPSWAYVVIRDAGAAKTYDVVATVDAAGAETDTGAHTDGAHTDADARPAPYGADPGGTDVGTDPSSGTREIALGPCVVETDVCTAGGLLGASVHEVVSVRLTTPDGTTWATGVPRAARP